MENQKPTNTAKDAADITKCKEMLSNLKNLLGLELTSKLRSTILTVVQTGDLLLLKDPGMALRFLNVFYSMLMTLQQIALDKAEIKSIATSRESTKLQAMTEITFDAALSEWENFIAACNKEKSELDKQLTNKRKI